MHYWFSFDNALHDFMTLKLNPPRPLLVDSVCRESRNWYGGADLRQPRVLATRVNCEAHSRTWATEPGAELSWSE